MAQVNFRIDDDLKSRADSEFKKMGLTFSAAITLMCSQVVMKHRLPFPIETPEATPSDSAMRQGEYTRGAAMCGRSFAERFEAFAATQHYAPRKDYTWNRQEASERSMKCCS